MTTNNFIPNTIRFGCTSTCDLHPVKPSPKTPNYWISWKSEISLKPQLFIWFIAHTATAFWYHFHHWIIKNMDPPTLAAQITDKSQKCLQSGLQETPKRHHKVDKNWHQGLKVAVGCPHGPPGHQTGHSGYPKLILKVSKMQVLPTKVTHSSSPRASSSQ